jgi:hypothetical protein
MALDAENIKRDVESAVKAALISELVPPKDPSKETLETAMAGLAKAIAAAVPIIIKAIKEEADVTGVTAGDDKVTGGID